ncbi:multidrug transporter EmrE-like cation transporter [Paraburkholderia tropica]|uniref:hypothetical protein n=2 Tax=Paraburkholderia tropica TaxID=92647 RepID=UPI0017C9E410|nr:hypothetical protein [Paraburkholderia tropica]MBB3003183.1 multidrug transporter EmrE-like cation transporter [Paraburkholderia tropica]
MFTSSRSRRIMPVVLILGAIACFLFGIVCLRRAFDVFDIDVDFWVWFGRAVVAFLLGAAGVHFGTQKIGLK